MNTLLQKGKIMNKTMCIMWCVAAVMSLISYFTMGFDHSDLTIAALDFLLAWDRYQDYKREGA